jgi:hypothetical protein
VLLAASFDQGSPALNDQLRAFSEKASEICKELKIDAPLLATKVKQNRLYVKLFAAARFLAGNPHRDGYKVRKDFSALMPDSKPAEAPDTSGEKSKALAEDIQAELIRLRSF